MSVTACPANRTPAPNAKQNPWPFTGPCLRAGHFYWSEREPGKVLFVTHYCGPFVLPPKIRPSLRWPRDRSAFTSLAPRFRFELQDTLGAGMGLFLAAQHTAAPTKRASLLQLRRAWNRRPPQPLHDRHCLANTAASASSTLPAAFAFHARTFHEHCNVHSLNGGFSGGTTGSILTSRTTSQDSGHSPQGVLRLNWRELLFGEAARIMHMMRVSFQENLLHLDAEVARQQSSEVQFLGRDFWMRKMRKPGTSIVQPGCTGPRKCPRSSSSRRSRRN